MFICHRYGCTQSRHRYAGLLLQYTAVLCCYCPFFLSSFDGGMSGSSREEKASANASSENLATDLRPLQATAETKQTDSHQSETSQAARWRRTDRQNTHREMEEKTITQASKADSTASNYKNPPPDRQHRQSSSCCSVRRLTWSRVVRAASRRRAFPPCILRNSPHRPPAAQSQRPRTARQCLPLAQRSRGRPHLQQKTPRRFWTCPVFVPSLSWHLIVFS